MAKGPTLSDVTNIYTSAPTINANNDRIESAFDNTLSRDGSAPNQMEADLDMNSNDVLNVRDLDVSRYFTLNGSYIGSGDDETLAHAWANAPEDVQVDPVNFPGDYSAYHWAEKAEQFAADAAASAGANYTFDSLAALLATSDSYPVNTYLDTRKEGYRYQVAPVVVVDQHLTTAGGVKLYVVGKEISPGMFGATPGNSVNNAVEIQAAADWVKASWNAASWSWDREFNWGGLTYRSDAPINWSGIRQPRLKICNGQLYSRATGLIALDCSLTNGAIFENFLVYGPSDAPPRWGIVTGRALLSGGYPGVDGIVFEGVAGAWGYFGRGAYLSFAAEVQTWSDRAVFENRSRSLSAVSVACIDNMGIMVTQFGSEDTSTFQTLPTAATGNHSNICHNWGQVNIRRIADYNLTITAISKAAQAVVTVSPGTMAAANISPGSRVYISGGDMTEIRYRAYTVVSTGTDTLTIDVNSTGYTTYTGGATLQNQTGPALLVGGARTVHCAGAYFLTYGSPNVIIDCDDGGPPYDWQFQFQSERHANDQITIRRASGTVVLPQLHFKSTQTNQVASRSIIRVNGGGSVRFDGGSMLISNMGAAPSDGVFSPVGSFSLRGYHLEVPLAAALPNPASMVTCQAVFAAQDRSPIVTTHGQQLFFMPNSTAMTSPGLRWTGASLLAYRPSVPAERAVMIADSATTGDLNNISSRVNTEDKYTGKIVVNVTNNTLVFATNGATNGTWRDPSTGSIMHTPV